MNVDIVDDGEGVAVWIDDVLYDEVGAPSGAIDEVEKLINEHGRDWWHHAPEEWLT